MFKPQKKTVLRGKTYIPSMPSLVTVNQMDLPLVYTWLVSCPISIYKGESLKQVKKECKKYEARRYLAELILVNDRNKS